MDSYRGRNIINFGEHKKLNSNEITSSAWNDQFFFNR